MKDTVIQISVNILAIHWHWWLILVMGDLSFFYYHVTHNVMKMKAIWLSWT